MVRHNISTLRTPGPRGPPAPGRATGRQRQRSRTTQGPLRQMAGTSHLESPHRQPPNVAPPCSPQRSPLQPFTHPRPYHGAQHAQVTETGRQSPPTPKPPRGSWGLAGTQSQSRTPPSATPRVTFYDDSDNSHDGPGGRQRRQMSATAGPQRRPKRPQTERTKISTILPLTERARLVALSVRADTAEAAVSSASAAPSHAQTSVTAPRPHKPSAAPRGATPISTESLSARHAAATRHSPTRPTRAPTLAITHTTTRSRGGTGLRDGSTATNATTTQPTMTTQVPLSNPDTEHAEFPTLAAMQARSTGSVLHQHDKTGDTGQGTGPAMTENPESKKPEAIPSPTSRPSPAPARPRPAAEQMHTEPDNSASGDTPSPGIPAARDRAIMPPQPPRPPQSGEPPGLEELRRPYDVYHSTPSHNLLGALRAHFHDVRPERRFAAALLPHGATNICVRQLQALLIPGKRTPNDLIDLWIWSFNHQQPDQGLIWVPHPDWAHTLIAPPTDPRAAPSPGRPTRTAPQVNADALNIPPYQGLAYWESRTAPERGQNLRAMMERYAQSLGPEPHAEPLARSIPSTVAMVVLENGDY